MKRRFAVIPDGKGGTITAPIPPAVHWCGCFKVTRSDGSTHEELCENHANGTPP